jgi:hypothetical protein
MLHRLNGWQGIGVVASVLWLVFVGCLAAYEANLSESATTFLTQDINAETKLPIPTGPVTFESFLVKRERVLVPGRIALVMCVPLVVVWLAVYGLLATMRWVARGFKHDGT